MHANFSQRKADGEADAPKAAKKGKKAKVKAEEDANQADEVKGDEEVEI